MHQKSTSKNHEKNHEKNFVGFLHDVQALFTIRLFKERNQLFSFYQEGPCYIYLYISIRVYPVVLISRIRKVPDTDRHFLDTILPVLAVMPLKKSYTLQCKKIQNNSISLQATHGKRKSGIGNQGPNHMYNVLVYCVMYSYIAYFIYQLVCTIPVVPHIIILKLSPRSNLLSSVYAMLLDRYLCKYKRTG